MPYKDYQQNFWIVAGEQLQDLACINANYHKNTKIRQNLFMFQPWDYAMFCDYESKDQLLKTVGLWSELCAYVRRSFPNCSI